MTAAILQTAIKDAAGLGDPRARAATSAAIAAIVRELKSSGKFTLKGFGTLSVRPVAARTGRNPRTGEPIELAASTTVRFVASANLRQELRMPANAAPGQKAAQPSGATARAAQKPPARRAKANAAPASANAAPASKRPAKAAAPRRKVAASKPPGRQHSGAAAQSASNGAG